MPRLTPRERIGVGLAIVAAAAVLSFRGIYEPDLWWHLAQGRENASGYLMRTNLFSFSHPDYRQHFTSWLFETIAYVAWMAGSDTAIQILQAALLAAMFGVVYAACRWRAPAAAASAALLLGAFVIEPRAIPRPHLISFLGMAFCALMIERACARRAAASLVWVVPVVAVWSNFHVECVSGVVFVALFALGEIAHPSRLPRRDALRALLVAGAAGAAMLANPYGWGLLRYLYENSAVPGILDIAELRRPSLPAYRAFYLYLSVIGLLLVVQVKTMKLSEVLVAVAFAALGLRYLRLTPLVFLATAPIVAARIGALMTRGLDGRAVVVTALALAALGSRLPLRALMSELDVGTGALTPAGFFSPGAMAFARQQGLAGPLFNSQNLGGYLAWTLYPQARVFQDARLQAYPPGHFAAIRRAEAGAEAEWDALVAGVDWAILSIRRPTVLSGVGRFPRTDWATVYWDNAVELVVRRKGAYANLAPSREYQLVTPDAELFSLVGRLSGDAGERIRAEARRQRSDNPDGFLAAAVLCGAKDAEACARLDRFAAERPDLADVIARVRRGF